MLYSLQRANTQKVEEQTFYQLVQFFAICLFECAQEEDWGPAKTLMTMCFTFYYEGGSVLPTIEVDVLFYFVYIYVMPVVMNLHK